MTNLQQRVVSGVVLAAIVLALTYVGGLPFRLLCAAIAAAMFYEWSAMSVDARNAGARVVAGAGLAAVLMALVGGLSAAAILAILGAAVIIALLHGFFVRSGYWSAAGLAYAGLSGLSLAMLRGDGREGLTAILFLFAVVWATDILAYFVGRTVGGPKLAPAISPGKTWSGAIGGAVAGVTAGGALAHAAGLGAIGGLVLVALLLSVAGQIGDLFESWVKRRHHVKDSGSLIPGHGGVMDRVDGLVVAALALYLIGGLAGELDRPAGALFVVP